MFLNILLLVIGLILLVKGADFFVDGSSKLAKALKIPPLIIGLTLVSIGTSAPEASVSINSSLNGMNDMSISNVIGSNIFNAFLIIGISSLICPLVIGTDVKKYDLPILLLLNVILLIFCFVITPYTLDIFESISFLILLVSYILFLIARTTRLNKKKAKKMTKELMPANNTITNKPKKELPLWVSIILAILGLAGVIFGGDLVVNNVSSIAKSLGMSESLVGLTIVSIGTSLPELVTSVVASVKKENDIALGNVIGSNIFNIVFILGLSSTISTLTVSSTILVDLIIMLLSALIIFIISRFSKNIKKWQGAMFVAMYVAYLIYIIVRN